MPAEWQRHFATIMIYPERRGSWCNGGAAAKRAFFEIARHICADERLFIAVSEGAYGDAEKLFSEQIAVGKITLWKYACNDCWARDTAPTFVKSGGKTLGVKWSFNAWGGDFNGLYKDYAADDAFALECCKNLGVGVLDASPFVLEGGSIHSNGAGVIVATEECLLSAGRNPNLTKAQIEGVLVKFVGAKKVIWLPYGVSGDETDGHVDNICAFAGEGLALLAYGGSGEQKRRCKADLKVLKSEGIKVVKLPFPRKPVKFTADELSGFEYEEGEIVRTEDDVLAASYANFYICNAGVIVPQFGDKNDKKAVGILKKVFKDKKIIPVNTLDIIKGGGNIHCLTQQIPL